MRTIDADKITDSEIHYYLGRDYISCTEDIRELINDQPTVDSVVHGHWVKSDEYSDEPDYSCSECKCTVERVSDDYGGTRALTTDYCPYCGAKMDEDTESANNAENE